ncbi:hypothetical protein BC332_25960 [Capsicum chinense]|nr:hypothetical protein BC332_25960 [Capsicum chinense]
MFDRIENSNPSGSEEVEDDDVIEMIHDACGYTNMQDTTNSWDGNEDPNVHATKFYRLLEDGQTKLYPGCTNPDPMHIERNVSESFLSTIMSMVGKTKDTLKSRYDLVDLGIRQSLHPIEDRDNMLLPMAFYTLSSEEKLKLCDFLANLKNISTKFNKSTRNDNEPVLDGEISVFKYCGQTKGASDGGNRLPHDEFNQACNYVLENCEEISQYREEYMRQIEVEGSTRAHQVHKNGFIDWFRAHIFLLSSQGRANNEIISLAVGPEPLNSGFLVREDVSDSNKEYYGVLKDIYELCYTGNRKVHLFKCHWCDVAHLGKRYKIDKYGFTSVNTQRVLNTNEPFVLASQSEQVFYLNDLVDKDWLLVVKTNPRDLFNMPEFEREASLNDEVYQQDEVEDILCGNNQETNIEVSLHRDDVEVEIVLPTNDQVNEENGFINDNDTDVSANEESEEEFLDDNDEMRGAGRGKSGRGGVGHGHRYGSFAERTSFKTISNLQIQPVGVIVPSLETGQSSNPSQGPLQTERMPSGPVKGTSPETQSSRTLDENVRLSVEVESGVVRISNILLHCMHDKFEVRNGLPEHKLQGFVISTMQRLFRTWKSQLHVIYSSYEHDKDRLSHRPEDVELDDWKHLVEYFGTNEFKGPLQQLVVKQHSEEIDNPMTSHEILSLVLGVRSGYFREKGYGKKPPKKSQTQQANIEASVSSTIESMRQEMQLDMERKLQEEREQMAADLKRQMDQDLQKKLEEEREHMKGEVEKIFQEKMVALMVLMQQVFS